MFLYHTEVKPDWIDHNGHMRDAYYGLVFSHAGVAAQEEIGFDPEYRDRTGCSIFLLEDHKFFLREVKLGDALTVEARVLDSDAKRFHLYLRLLHDEALCAVAEYMELHVNRLPTPRATPIPEALQARLKVAQTSPEEVAALEPRSGRIGLRR